MNLKHGFLASKEFFDDANFPYGFRKSGDFIIPEATMLSSIGFRLRQLELGNASPETEIERAFIDVCTGIREPETAVERVWVKYKSLIGKRKEFHGLNNAKPTVEDDYSDDEL